MSRALALLRRWTTTAQRTARLACGVPDYDTYVAHLRAHHPECEPMAYAQFFRERQDARYKRGGRAPCC